MKALIVEDSTTLCAIYEAYLAGLGLEIHIATTLEEGKASLLRVKADFVLLDIELPMAMDWIYWRMLFSWILCL